MFKNSYLRMSEVMAGWDNRLRTQQSLVWAPRGLAIGLGVSLLAALAARLFPLLDQPTLWIVSGAAALISLLVALLGVWVWPRPPLKMARRFDQLFGLRERMSTAVELSEGRLPVQSDALARLQLGDALEAAGHVNAADGIPLQLEHRDWLMVGVLLAALVAALVLPNPQSAILQERREVKEAVEEQVEQLEALREEIAEDTTLTEEERAAIAEALSESIQSLEQPGVSREEAVAELSAAEERLREIAERAQERANASSQPLRTAGQSFSTEGLTDALGQALEQGNFELASDLLENLLDPDGVPLTPEEQAALSQELAEAADQLDETNPEMAEDLREASEAIAQGNQAGAQQSLSRASAQLSEGGQQIGQAQAASQAAQSAASRAGQGQQSVAQAGRAQQPGQGQTPGPGQQPGQPGQPAPGRGTGSQPGEQAGGGAGEGAGTGEAIGGPISGQMPTNNDPERDEERDYEPVFAPERPGGEGGPVVDLSGEGDPGGDPGIEGDFVENPAGEAQVPYSEVYADYADAANEALESEYVPLGMRDLVRDYFSSLDPEQ